MHPPYGGTWKWQYLAVRIHFFRRKGGCWNWSEDEYTYIQAFEIL